MKLSKRVVICIGKSISRHAGLLCPAIPGRGGGRLTGLWKAVDSKSNSSPIMTSRKHKEMLRQCVVPALIFMMCNMLGFCRLSRCCSSTSFDLLIWNLHWKARLCGFSHWPVQVAAAVSITPRTALWLSSLAPVLVFNVNKGQDGPET